jgi:hypothetical protein
MKNLKRFAIISLLATSAFSGYAEESLNNAGDTTIKLKGGLDFQYGHLFQKSVSKENGLTANQKRDAFSTEGNIRFEVERETDQDFKYGAKLVALTTTNANGGVSANGSHIWVSRDDLGKVELGSPFSAARAMHLSAGEVSVANGMMGWSDYAVLKPSDKEGMHFRDSDKLFMDSLKGPKNEPARKVTYYTPEFSGIQLGVSYTPDTHNLGDAEFGKKDNLKDDKTRQDLKDLISYGVSFKQNLADGVDLKLALTGEYANKTGYITKKDPNDPTKTIKDDVKLGKLRAYNIGAHLAYGNFGFAGSYGSLGKSFSAKSVDGEKRNSTFYTLGANYKQGPAGISLVHFNGNHRGNKLKSYSLGASYDFAKGLSGNIELTRFTGKGTYKDKNTQAIGTYKPKGYALVTGLSVSL